MDQLRALRVFVRVIAEGSLAGAARALDLAPAVVTRIVAELEAHLGARLLNRTTRRLALTDAGETYHDQARHILANLDDADALAGAANSQPSGVLRVLCPPAFAVHQLAKHLPDFRRRHPMISIEIATPGPVSVADENFDVSILSIGQQPLQGEFVAHRLASSAFVLCAAPGYLDQHGRPTDPQQLLDHQGLLPAVAAVRSELTLYRDAVAGNDGQVTRLTLSASKSTLLTSNLDMLLACATAGLGIAGLPSFIAEQALRDRRLERLLPQWRGAKLSLYVAMPTRKHVPARTRVFVDYLIKTFGGSDHDPWLAPTA
jgi:DNA-binding transcriptional LysR family regulator